jgi:hypothetical protein
MLGANVALAVPLPFLPSNRVKVFSPSRRVEERPSAISVPGTRPMWLRENVRPGPQQAFMIRREFAPLCRSSSCRCLTCYPAVAVWLTYSDDSNLTRITYFVY